MTKISSTMLSVGTLLRAAEDSGAEVKVLVQGEWLVGRVIGCDGLGAVLDGAEGGQFLVRLDSVVAVSFSRAATQLGLSQQALSAQIRCLEEQVGRSLFFRTTRRVELTAAGRALLPKAQLALRAALEALDTARAAEPERRYNPWL